MKRWIGWLLMLCVACSKSEGDKAAPSAPSTAVVAAASTEAAPSVDVPTDDEAKAIAAIKSNPEGKVKAFVVYHQRWLETLEKFGVREKDYQQKERAKSHEGLTGAAATMLALHDMGKDFKAGIEKAQAETGLSDKEVGALSELMANAQAQEPMQKSLEQFKSLDTEAQLAKFAQAIESAPPEAREELKQKLAQQLAQMKETEATVVDAASMKQMRAKYGDPAVEAMLAVTPELKAQMLKFQAATNK